MKERSGLNVTVSIDCKAGEAFITNLNGESFMTYLNVELCVCFLWE